MSTINLYEDCFSKKVKTIHVKENIAIKDILHIDYKQAIITVNGKLADENTILKDEDFCVIKQFVGAATAGIVLGIVAVAGTLYSIADGITQACTGKSILSHVKEWLMPNEEANNEVKKLPGTRGCNNGVLLNKPFSIILGKTLHTPDMVGTPYIETTGYRGKTQYYRALYLVGYNKLKVSNFKFGELLVSKNDNSSVVVANAINQNRIITSRNDSNSAYNNSDIQIEICEGTDSALYPCKVVAEQPNITLSCPADNEGLNVTRFSANNPYRVELELTFPNGLWNRTAGETPSRSVVLGFKWRFAGDNTWNDFEEWSNNGGYDASRIDFSYTGHSQTRLWYNANIQEEFRITVAHNFTTKADFFGANGENIKDGRYIEILVYRSTKEPKENSASTVVLSNINTYCFDYEKVKDMPANTVLKDYAEKPIIPSVRERACLVALKMKVDENVTGSLNNFNMICESYARTCAYNANTDTYTWSNTESVTNNPASLALKLLQHPTLGKRAYRDDQLDLHSFGECYKNCERQAEWVDEEENGHFNRFACNGVIASSKRLNDYVSAVLDSARSFLVPIGNKYGVFVDKEEATPVCILNNQNVLSASNEKEYRDIPDGYRVTFIDENNNFQQATMTIMTNPDVEESDPNATLEKIDIPYITNPQMVRRKVLYEDRKFRLRPEIWKRTVTTEGNLINIGDLVEIQDDTICVGLDSGEIIGFEYGNNGQADVITAIVLDKKINIQDTSKTYGIKIACTACVENGIIEEATPSIYTWQFNLEEPMYSNVVPVEIVKEESMIHFPCVGDICAIGEHTRETTLASCTSKQDNCDGTFDLVFVPYDSKVHEEDSVFFEYDPKISPPQALANINPVPYTPLSSDDVFNAVNQLEANSLPSDKVENVTAIPSEEKISVAWTFLADNSFRNSIKHFEVELIHDLGNETYSRSFITKNNAIEIPFIREFDGYPEASDFANEHWTVRVTPVNIYGNKPKDETQEENTEEGSEPVVSDFTEYTEATLNTETYGTWTLAIPQVEVKVSNRSVTLFVSEGLHEPIKEQYGKTRYRVSVARKAEGEEEQEVFFKPSLTNDVYNNENAYKVENALTDFVEVDEVFSQTMPLREQNKKQYRKNEYPHDLKTEVEFDALDTSEQEKYSLYSQGEPKDTEYIFRVVAFNESEANSAHAQKTATAKATGTTDLITNAINANQLSEGCVTFDKIHVTALSARGMVTEQAQIGEIFGNAEKDNFWDLSTGEFRIGNERELERGYNGTDEDDLNAEYFHFRPADTNDPDSTASITMKISNFELSSVASKIKGDFVVENKPAENTSREEWFKVSNGKTHTQIEVEVGEGENTTSSRELKETGIGFNKRIVTDRTIEYENAYGDKFTPTAYLGADNLGLIQIAPMNTIPRSYMPCFGQAISRTEYAELFSLIGTTFGEGNGSTTFNLPNLLGRFVKGNSQAGQYEAEGLPNIKGWFYAYCDNSLSARSDNSLFKIGYSDWGYTEGEAGSYQRQLTFDASQKSPVYKDDVTHVTPENLSMVFIIKVTNADGFYDFRDEMLCVNEEENMYMRVNGTLPTPEGFVRSIQTEQGYYEYIRVKDEEGNWLVFKGYVIERAEEAENGYPKIFSNHKQYNFTTGEWDLSEIDGVIGTWNESTNRLEAVEGSTPIFWNGTYWTTQWGGRRFKDAQNKWEFLSSEFYNYLNAYAPSGRSCEPVRIACPYWSMSNVTSLSIFQQYGNQSWMQNKHKIWRTNGSQPSVYSQGWISPYLSGGDSFCGFFWNLSSLITWK